MPRDGQQTLRGRYQADKPDGDRALVLVTDGGSRWFQCLG